jgi:hypothetical protein
LDLATAGSTRAVTTDSGKTAPQPKAQQPVGDAGGGAVAASALPINPDRTFSEAFLACYETIQGLIATAGEAGYQVEELFR